METGSIGNIGPATGLAQQPANQKPAPAHDQSPQQSQQAATNDEQSRATAAAQYGGSGQGVSTSA